MPSFPSFPRENRSVQEMSGKTPGSPRHPSSRRPRPSEFWPFLWCLVCNGATPEINSPRNFPACVGFVPGGKDLQRHTSRLFLSNRQRARPSKRTRPHKRVTLIMLGNFSFWPPFFGVWFATGRLLTSNSTPPLFRDPDLSSPRLSKLWMDMNGNWRSRALERGEHFGRTDKIALITCLKKLNVSGAFLIRENATHPKT